MIESQGNNIKTESDSVKMPINSVITKPKGADNYVVRKIVYPWDILKIMHEVLNAEVASTMISKNSSIAESAIIKGPCVIEDGASVDDFSKIIGPIYIGKNAKLAQAVLLGTL